MYYSKKKWKIQLSKNKTNKTKTVKRKLFLYKYGKTSKTYLVILKSKVLDSVHTQRRFK